MCTPVYLYCRDKSTVFVFPPEADVAKEAKNHYGFRQDFLPL
jgi:hypothetical protein